MWTDMHQILGGWRLTFVIQTRDLDRHVMIFFPLFKKTVCRDILKRNLLKQLWIRWSGDWREDTSRYGKLKENQDLAWRKQQGQTLILQTVGKKREGGRQKMLSRQKKNHCGKRKRRGKKKEKGSRMEERVCHPGRQQLNDEGT